MKIAFRLLRAFCPPHLYEEIEGDLIQKFNRDVKTFGETSAKWRLLWNVIRFFRAGILLRNKYSINPNSIPMLQNYFKITFRNLSKRRVYAFINVFGLAVGVATCLVIGKYVEFETSYDAFHPNANNIYRVVSSFYTDGAKESYSGYDLGPSLQQELPEIKRVVRTHDNSSVVSFVNSEGKAVRFYEKNILIADSTFFDVFSFSLIYGNGRALYNPYSIVLTKSVATKFFGDTNPIGKVLSLPDCWIEGQFTVAAVINDVPVNSHFYFQLVMPMHNLLQTEFYQNKNSRWDNFQTYIELYELSDLKNLQAKIPAFAEKYKGNDKAINSKADLFFQPLQDIHYSPDLNQPNSLRTKIYLFVIIALFILRIAWVNYVNLATARAMERAREVGVKKALGVLRSQLISQFIFESLLINLLAIFVAVGIAWLSLQFLNSIIGQSLTIEFAQWQFWILLMALFLTGSLTAGFYPAFVLSSFKTTEVIKGKITNGSSGLSLRNGLVTFQFACSLLLMIATFVVYRQVSFMKSRDKNFEAEQVIIVKGPEVAEQKSLATRMISLKNELRELILVKAVATSFSVPAKSPSLSTGIRKLGRPVEENRVGNIYWVDPDFMNLYKIGLLTGNFWNETFESGLEVKNILVNEEAVRVFQLGTVESAIGEKLTYAQDTFSIIGVVKNHDWHSARQPNMPMIFRVEKVAAANISIQLAGDFLNTLEQMKKKYLATFPDDSFSYYFLDDAFNNLYQSELQFGKLFGAFSILAILIGCLGLWGLASFATLHRLKEIGIRKVLGASVRSILILLSSQFLKPLIIGSLIALPLAWWGLSQWLNGFPYRIRFSVADFSIPLLLLFAIALLTIGFQTTKAATSNPVDSLKTE